MARPQTGNAIAAKRCSLDGGRCRRLADISIERSGRIDGEGRRARPDAPCYERRPRPSGSGRCWQCRQRGCRWARYRVTAECRTVVIRTWISINQARKVASWKRNTDLSLCHHCALSGQGAAKRGHSARLRPTPSGLLCRRRRFAGAHGLGRLGVGLYCLQRPVYRRRETGSSARRRRSRPSLPTAVGVAAPTACREKSGSIGSGAPIGRTK